MRQQSFLPKLSLAHGGDTRAGKRKIARPFDPRRPLHVVLRSSRARGRLSLQSPRLRGLAEMRLEECADKHRVRLYRSANVGNHIHLLVQSRTRRAFQAFLREIAGALAVMATGAAKGRPEKFWDGLAYSRIVSWGRDLAHTSAYIAKNLMEGLGAIDRYGADRGLAVLDLSSWTRPG